MLNCTTPKYRELYARWLVNPGKLLDVADLRPGERVIDLCGGTGVVASEALKRGARTAIVFDLNPRSAVFGMKGNAEELDVAFLRFVDYLHQPDGECAGLTCSCRNYRPNFDLIVCRQAINYLNLDKVANAAHAMLRPGGRFVFNTFGKPRFLAKTYKHQGKRFFELAGHFRDHVVHVQAGLGIGVDVTKFRWYRSEEIKHAMRGAGFWPEERTQGNSSTYLCRKASHVRKLP